MPRLVYLIGAGRSGTTVLSLLLGSSGGVRALGELHQLSAHASGERSCSCGRTMHTCAFWSGTEAIDFLNELAGEEYELQASELESHRYLYKYLLRPGRSSNYETYVRLNKAFVNAFESAEIVIDSAKYLGRALALNGIGELNVRYVYVVRDPRGVVDSFSRRVQTSRSTLSACLYYLLVNMAVATATRTFLRRKVIRIRYEDLLSQPESTLRRMSQFLEHDFADVIDLIRSKQPLQTGHFIGGNRLVQAELVRLRTDDTWRRRTAPWRRIAIWLLTLPFSWIYGYRL